MSTDRRGHGSGSRHDIVDDPLPEGGFDLIHARAVLMHLPRRVEVLARLAAGLRPGGWLMVEDLDIYPVEALARGDYATLFQRAVAAVAPAGLDFTWARHLPERLLEVGLVEVAVESESGVMMGGSPQAEFAQLSLTQLREPVLAAGVPAALFERVWSALSDARRCLPIMATVAAWGRRPGG